MPWDAKSFKAKHNHGLSSAQAAKGARVATAMVKAGVPEGEAIATGNARAEGKLMHKRKGRGVMGSLKHAAKHGKRPSRA